MKPAVTVRRGNRDDRDFVRDLGRRSATSNVSAVRVAKHDDVLDATERLTEFVFTRKHDAFIAEDDGERVGFLLVLYDFPDEVTLTEQAFFAYAAVEPHARRRGVASALFAAAEERARAVGMQYVSLMVTEDNTPARTMYETSGFVTERRMMTKVL